MDELLFSLLSFSPSSPIYSFIFVAGLSSHLLPSELSLLEHVTLPPFAHPSLAEERRLVAGVWLRQCA